MELWIEDTIVYPTLVLFCFSIISDICVIISTTRFKRALSYEYGNDSIFSHDYTIGNLILWLAAINLLWELTMIPEYGVNWTHMNPLCLTIAIAAQFFAVLNSLWQILIASYLFHLLTTDITQQSLDSSKKRQHHKPLLHDNHNQRKQSNMIDVIRWVCDPYLSCNFYLRNPFMFNLFALLLVIISAIGAIIPLIWDNDNHYAVIYNYTKNGYNYGGECWLKSASFQLISYGPFMLSVVLDVIVLLIAVCKYYQTKWFTKAYLYLIKRLSTWVIVFVIIRVLPFADRLLSWIVSDDHDFQTPLWLVLMHNYALASMGLANGLVWFANQKRNQRNSRGMINNTGNINKKDNKKQLQDDDKLEALIADVVEDVHVNVHDHGAKHLHKNWTSFETSTH